MSLIVSFISSNLFESSQLKQELIVILRSGRCPWVFKSWQLIFFLFQAVHWFDKLFFLIHVRFPLNEYNIFHFLDYLSLYIIFEECQFEKKLTICRREVIIFSALTSVYFADFFQQQSKNEGFGRQEEIMKSNFFLEKLYYFQFFICDFLMRNQIFYFNPLFLMGN